MEDSVNRIKKFTKIIFACLLVYSLFTGVVYAEDQPAAPAAAPAAPATAATEAAPAAPAPPAVTGTATMGIFNHYIFRGQRLSDHSAVFEPALTINYAGFSVNAWSNIDTHETSTPNFYSTGVPTGRGHNEFDETDLTLSYTYNIDKLALTGGFIWYGTQYAPETQEIFVSGTYDMIAHPTLAIYRDIMHSPGTYLNLSFSQSIPVFKMANGDATIDLGAGFGYEAGDSNVWKTYRAGDAARGYLTGSQYSALQDGNVKVGVTVPVTSKFSVQPIVQYWFPLSSDASKRISDSTGLHDFNQNNGRLQDTFVYGLNLNFNF